MKKSVQQDITRDIIEGMLVAFVSIGIALLSAPYLPDKIPIHFNVHWHPDGYASARVGLLLLACMPVFIWTLITAFYWLATTECGKLRLDEASAKWVRLLRVFIALFMISVEASIVAFALGWLSSPRIIFMPMLGLLFIAIGMSLPHLTPNWVAGIRLPWTIISESVWRRTHRIGGYGFIALGASALFLPLMPTWTDLMWFITFLVFTVVTICYSYCLYRMCR